MVRGLRKIRDKARAKKATTAQMARASREIERAECKAAREDMGIVDEGNVHTTRELNACLKLMSDEWNEQVPKQMRTFLEGKWDGWEQNQLKPAAQRRLARSLCTNTTHWLCSAAPGPVVGRMVQVPPSGKPFPLSLPEGINKGINKRVTMTNG